MSWLPEGVDGAVALACFAIFLWGGFVKGGLGFGLPLATISVLPLVIPVDMALALNVVVQPITNLGQLWSTGQARAAARRFWILLPPLAAGVALGTAFLTSLDPDRLTLLLGLFIIAFTLLSLGGITLPIRPERERAAGIATGFLAGVVGALTAANGAVFVMYLVALRLGRDLFRATLGLLFLVSGGLLAGSFWSVGLLDGPRAAFALLCVAPCLLGMWAGNLAASRLPAETFRRAILLALFCLGLNFVLRGAGVL